MANRLVAAGVPCDLQVWEKQVHVFHAAASWVPEARLAIEEIGAFVRELAERGCPPPSRRTSACRQHHASPPYADRVTALSDPDQTLIADLAKKSGLVWISYDGRSHAIWHEWVGDAVCLVTGGLEQPLPGIADRDTVTLLLRSKTTRALAAEATARVEIVAPASEHWEAVTTALKSGRLNLHDSPDAIERWARDSLVVRLVPISDVSVPGELADRPRPHSTPTGHR
ncbi:hypothetical protein [Aeromicrobium sp. UC242_57]|uniref:hypothetical protein n=1 Tax=Aeromicrobium sp. UC242_57 TaxID=3374624 RepID=UPI0037958531